MAFALYMGYSFGAYNYGGWIFGAGSQVPFNESLRKIALKTPDWTRLWHLVGGAGAMSALTFMRYRFPWWPLHPIGFPIAGLWLMSHSWFSIFLAWLCKAVALKYWGPRGFQAARPFFLGAILGQFTSAGVWLLIDAFTGMTDNRIFSW